MKLISSEETERVLDYKSLVEALREGFRSGAVMPARVRHEIDPVDGTSLFVMPAWQKGAAIIVKLMAAFPGNARKGLQTSSEVLAMFDPDTGQVKAIIDSFALTNMRTAATSALAADYLARRDAKVLAVFATGPLAPYMARAHASIRAYDSIVVWGRSLDRAEATAAAIRKGGLAEVTATTDLEAATRNADVISAATRATSPIVRGVWLKPGAHVDLVGGYKYDMRESDDETISKARIYLDQYAALNEAGDIAQPLQQGVIDRDSIVGDLAGLANGTTERRRNADEITLFKSVGCGLEDLYAAQLLVRRLEAAGHA